MRRFHPRATIVVSVLVLFPAPSSGGGQAGSSAARPTVGRTRSGQAGDEDAGPADVFARVALFRSELDRIRHEMGKPRDERSEIRVLNAAPREVFFQAVTLFRKVDRLSFELIRESTPVPEPPPSEIRPAHNLVVVDGALAILRRIEVKLGIPPECSTIPCDQSKTPTDVYRSIVQANRQLNRLLDHRFDASDVYEQLTLAIGYTSRILARFPGTRSIPEPPPLERGKTPADVYRRLLHCFERTRRIAERLGVGMLTLKVDPEDLESATPSDAYDVASLLVSELASLHARFGDGEPPPGTYYPGRKFPSHAWQRAGLLSATSPWRSL